MLNSKDLLALAKATAKAEANAPVAYSYEGQNFSYDQVNSTLRAELNELVGTPESYRENKNLLFTIIEQTIGEVLPKKLENRYADFAEVKTFGQGEKPLFLRRSSNDRIRAKQFISKVGLAGVYEVFKLGGIQSFEVPTSAVGGAAQIGIEEFLDGRVDFNELIEIVLEGIEETIQKEAGKALIAGINQLPSANFVEWTGFDEQEFDRLLTIADAYGTGKATIYCDFMFAAKIMPNNVAYFSDNMKQKLWDDGYFAVYKGHNVIILPNSIEDATNTSLAADPGYAWIVPASAQKPVMISIEGATLTRETENGDWSRDIMVYKKAGVAALFTNDICVYHDKSLKKELVAKVEGA